jgi:hypothetical protein
MRRSPPSSTTYAPTFGNNAPPTDAATVKAQRAVLAPETALNQ